MYEILNNTREAVAVYFPGTTDEEGASYSVGGWYSKRKEDGRGWDRYKVITSIRVSCDLPGLHCNMDRLTIWADEELLLEAPLHSVQCVSYK